MPGGNKKVTQTYTNMQLLFKYVWPFCYHIRIQIYRTKYILENFWNISYFMLNQ